MIQKPKGTKDLLPSESYKWQYVEQEVFKIFENYGFKEIRIPMFEYTELFQRSVGETTDVVQKEMYTFLDKGDRSITLRPEGTAGVVRAYLENGMESLGSPLKMCYNLSLYRYENVQKGRYREFHQLGAEIFGSNNYMADVEIISLGNEIFKKLNIPNVKLYINSIGCPKCRKEYQTKLKEFLQANINEYCDTCKTRFEKNPMRILDCKEKKCKQLNIGAPRIIDFLCEECKEHFENLKSSLDIIGIKYEVDSSIVRGLDYYTKTVFEFVDEEEGYTLLGGGRYDGLVTELGGKETPAIGFGLGVERLMETFYKYNIDKISTLKRKPDLYIIAQDEKTRNLALIIARALREQGIYVEQDINGRSFGTQFKQANKQEAKFALPIGQDEIETGKAKLKNMETGIEKEIEIKEIDSWINFLKY